MFPVTASVVVRYIWMNYHCLYIYNFTTAKPIYINNHYCWRTSNIDEKPSLSTTQMCVISPLILENCYKSYFINLSLKSALFQIYMFWCMYRPFPLFSACFRSTFLFSFIFPRAWAYKCLPPLCFLSWRQGQGHLWVWVTTPLAPRCQQSSMNWAQLTS